MNVGVIKILEILTEVVLLHWLSNAVGGKAK